MSVTRPGRGRAANLHMNLSELLMNGTDVQPGDDDARIVQRVGQQIRLKRLAAAEAAREIGVGRASLEAHLRGGYVRSDSLAKYRAWLDSPAPISTLPFLVDASSEPDSPTAPTEDFHGFAEPAEPLRVVDLFAGCGGLSLGFELLEGGRIFNVVMAIELEEVFVKTYNANQGSGRAVCRQADLSDFLNRAEVLAFYLDHVARTRHDLALQTELDRLGLGALQAALARLDGLFVDEVRAIRSSPGYRSARRSLGSGVLGQTSVSSFYRSLAIPANSNAKLPALIWGTSTARTDVDAESAVPSEDEVSVSKAKWLASVRALDSRATKTGRGQLASSAGRISAFLLFLQSPPMSAICDAWTRWDATRSRMRRDFFGSADAESQLKRLYSDGRQVDVLLGGPPCQGFSRIGRGKIRSLREHGVQVHEDVQAGDARNRLLEAYVLFVDALAPRAFLFENVRHFEAKVTTPEGAFHASEILSEAITDISCGDLQYSIGSSIVDASKHLVPQTRERYFMVGVRSQVNPDVEPLDCLTLSPRRALPLRVALAGLPEPLHATRSGMDSTVEIHLAPTVGAKEEDRYLQWVRQKAPVGDGSLDALHADGHLFRAPRRDDRDFFALMGPGKRWMDYRCDETPTLAVLQRVLTALESIVDVADGDASAGVRDALSGITSQDLRAVRTRLDGSLLLRLLLETIEPLRGELNHHLLTPAYLGKREGNHGDWLARLDSSRPGKTIVSHMGKDTYAYIHPFEPRTLSVREAARVQTFPDWFRFGSLSLVDAFRAIGNAVPPLLACQIAGRIATALIPAVQPAVAAVS